ncbi:MAG: amidohydrolase family protein [Candidatus Aminicenantes bacterium]|nr:amidohydrolase family protein [Candidatus Aminicenantes bacterium]
MKMNKINDLRVIDFHVHIGLKEHWYEWIHDYQKEAHSEYYERYEEMIDPERFAAYLKSHQIERAVILPEISPLTTGVVSNEYVMDFCQGNDIFLPFCTVNPFLVSQPAPEFKKYIKMGAKGIKLYPSYNHFYPNESCIYPLYEIAQEYKLPVLIHTGSSVFKGSKIKYADPIYLDDVASDFPDLPLLMAHSGRGLWYEKAFFLSRLHPNLYLEISGLPPKNLLNYFPDMEKEIDKFVYGSDWPGIKTINSNIEAIKKLPLAEKSIRKILYENASGILGLK